MGSTRLTETDASWPPFPAFVAMTLALPLLDRMGAPRKPAHPTVATIDVRVLTLWVLWGGDANY